MTPNARTRSVGGKYAPEDTTALFANKTTLVGECLVWTGRVDEKGYGRTGSRNGGAHRAAWIAANGAIPRGVCVLHRCDNPPCVNVAHLFLGTVADNNRDRHAKGRTVIANLAAGPRANAAKTKCVNGHLYDGNNTGKRANGRRWCRACARIREQQRRSME